MMLSNLSSENSPWTNVPSQLLGSFHAFFFSGQMNLRFLLLHEFIRGQQKKGKAVMIFGEKTLGEAIDSKESEEICGYKISMNLCYIFAVYTYLIWITWYVKR